MTGPKRPTNVRKTKTNASGTLVSQPPASRARTTLANGNYQNEKQMALQYRNTSAVLEVGTVIKEG
jgi:hypothetical protein